MGLTKDEAYDILELPVGKNIVYAENKLLTLLIISQSLTYFRN